MPKPLVTVFLPTFNRPAWLHESIKSLQAQQGADIQLVLLDNGSNSLETDTAVSCALEKFRNHIYIKKDANSFSNITEMQTTPISGDFVVEFTDDDIMLPGNLFRKVSALQNSGAGMIFSPAYHIDKDGKRAGQIVGGFVPDRPPTFDDMFPTSRLIMPSVMMTRKAWELQVEYSHTFGGEWGRYLSICKKYSIMQIREPLVELRIHPGSDTNRRGFDDGLSMDMHLRTWEYWLSQGYYPPKNVKDEMYRIYFDLAWNRYQEGEMMAVAAQDFCNIWP